MRYWLVLLGCFSLIGCGQSGALYLPTQANIKQHKYDRFLLYRAPQSKQQEQQQHGSF